jgi:hypothetical protein
MSSKFGGLRVDDYLRLHCGSRPRCGAVVVEVDADGTYGRHTGTIRSIVSNAAVIRWHDTGWISKRGCDELMLASRAEETMWVKE